MGSSSLSWDDRGYMRNLLAIPGTWPKVEQSSCVSLLQARSWGLDPSTILSTHHASKRDMTDWTSDSNKALCLQLGLWQFSGLLVTGH
jgi:hypothetical protein